MAEKPGQDSTQKSAEAATKAAGDISKQTMESLNWFGSAWIDAWGSMGSEVAEFVAERIREDVKTQHAMLKCKSAAELNAVQTAFVKKAIDQYSEETGKLVNLQREFLERLSKAKPG